MERAEKKFRILLLITNLGKGGAQKAFYDQAITLSAHYEISEAVFDHTDERIYDSGLPIHYLSEGHSGGIAGSALRLIRRAIALRKMVQQEKIDLVISHMDGANWVNALSFSSAKKIFVLHGTILFDRAQSRMKQWLRTRLLIPALYRRADRVVCVSQGIGHEMREISKGANLVHIPNFFDIDHIEHESLKALSSELTELFSEREVLISTGRLAKQKDQGALFAVLKKVRKKDPRVCLLIAGDGELRESLIGEALLQGLSVYHVWKEELPFHTAYDVYFMGFVKNPYALMRRSRLFLLPSGWEGFPLSLCEAMICGVTVLSTDCPTGPREILSAVDISPKYDLMHAVYLRDGVLLPLFDKAKAVSEWTESILHLLNDPGLCESMMVSARSKMELFGKEQVMRLWKKEIDIILAARRVPDTETV